MDLCLLAGRLQKASNPAKPSGAQPRLRVALEAWQQHSCAGLLGLLGLCPWLPLYDPSVAAGWRAERTQANTSRSTSTPAAPA
ncbi:hypothetical protein BDW75DRAFT_84274 [Aspergillus navahoensis]